MNYGAPSEHSYTSNNNINYNKRLLIVITRTILVSEDSLLLFELPTVPWLLIQLFLNKYTLTWGMGIYCGIYCEK